MVPTVQSKLNNLLGEVAQIGLAFGDDLGLEGAGPIAGSVDVELAKIAADGFAGGAVAGVAAAAAGGVVFGVAEVGLDLDLQESLDEIFHHLAEELFGVGDEIEATLGADQVTNVISKPVAVVGFGQRAEL